MSLFKISVASFGLRKIRFWEVEDILLRVGTDRLRMWNGFYFMSGNGSGVRRIDFILCWKMPFEYVDQVLSYVGKCIRIMQDISCFMSKDAFWVCGAGFILCREMPPECAGNILFCVGKCRLNKWNGFYLIPGNAAGLCRAYFILCRKILFEYAERILSYIETYRFIFQNVFLCTSLCTVSWRHKQPFDICLHAYVRPVVCPSLLHPFRYEYSSRSFIHIIAMNFHFAFS